MMPSQTKSFRAKSALTDFKNRFSAAFEKAEVSIGELETSFTEGKKHISELAQRVILSEFCERVVRLTAELNDQFSVIKLSFQSPKQWPLSPETSSCTKSATFD